MGSLASLPQISFTEKSGQEIESSVITTYEAIAGRTLAPGDPVRLFLEAVAAIIIQQRVLIDFSAKQNLLAYSTGEYLEHLGVLVGTERLKATKALTSIRFTLAAVNSSAITIPANTRVTPGGNIAYSTTVTATIPVGQLTVDVKAECTESGTKGNGYQPGQINKLVDPLPWVHSTTNITISEGGTDKEADDAYRERIRQAPEQFSCAGPDGAYKYWAHTAHQLIADVAVYSPSAGAVIICPLLTGGEIPGQEILDAVLVACNDDKVRPLTDHVSVLPPTTAHYDIALTYWISRQNSTGSVAIQQAVTNAVNDYVLWQKSRLGRDVNPSELIVRIMAAGAKRVHVTHPVFTNLTLSQVAVAGSIAANYGGLEDG